MVQLAYRGKRRRLGSFERLLMNVLGKCLRTALRALCAYRRHVTAVVLLMLLASIGGWSPKAQTQSWGGPKYRFDPNWPKPLPPVKDAQGAMRPQVTGGVGTHCVDSNDHIFQFNRRYVELGQVGLRPDDPRRDPRLGTVASAPVFELDLEGNVVNAWGDPSLTSDGMSAVLPQGTHGCSVDYEGNVWVGGNSDGVVQKWSHDGKKMLLQIGTKGVCDGPSTLAPQLPFPTCGAPGTNTSRTLLNEPAKIAVDPNPDPVTGGRGTIYIADGYGNHRVVVFNSRGQYLRQWGSAGAGPSQFYPTGGGHPHCVVLGNDRLLYVCDRSGNRVEVFDRTGNLRRTMYVIPPGTSVSGGSKSERAVSDVAFSPDREQRYMYVAYYGCGCDSPEGGRVYILSRETGAILGMFGEPGPGPGQFLSAHSIAVDSKSNVYIGESPMGQRTQRFVKVAN
jgi:hypothetical protein